MVHAPAENVYTQLSPVAFNVPPSRTWRILRKQFNYYESGGEGQLPLKHKHKMLYGFSQLLQHMEYVLLPPSCNC